MAKSPKKTRIVAGAGIAVISPDPDRASRIEQAMSEAITQALADGVSDPAEQRKRMLAARDEAMKG